uniref:Fibronectin type-III domain-containing protein n=1 Tax=Callorhinchus milii TaxID=7868 RepID=A0A4W3K7Z4_CALMI
MINALTSTSVLLTWGQNYEEECNADVDSECTDERHFTVRYREKEKNKKWLYQFCPTTKTVVDKLKPNTVYEFGVRVTKPKEDSIWGRATAHTTSATTSPSNTRTEQVKINKFNPYFKKDRNNGDMAKLKPSGKVNHIGPKHRKPDVITSAPGADLLVFDTLKSNRNPPSKEHRPMQSNPLPENDVVNKVEKKGIDSKPTSRNDKKEIAKQKAPATPSKANESKRPSSVNSSLPSNPGLEPHATEFQVPSSNHSNLFTSERASDLETKDKQQSTESEIPSSTKMPFTILSTTSKHTAEDKQKLPEIKAPSSTNSFLITSNPAHASNPVDIKQLKEPEVPYPNSSPFHPTSEPDAKDVEKLTEPEVPFSSISSFNPTTEPGTLGMQKFTDLETPLSSTSFFSNSKMTSTLDVTDGQKSTEKVTEGPPSNGNFYSIPSSTSELDTMDEQQFSEYVVPHSISSNVNTLSTPSEPDNVDKQEFTEHEVTSSNSSFFTTSTASSELHPPERQPNSGPGVHSSSSSISFTSNTSELNALGSQKSTELEVPSSTSSVLITSNTRAEADSINHNPFTEYNPPLANNPSRNEPGYQDKQPITEHYQSSIENSTHFNLNPVLEFDAPGHQGYTDHELPISDTPYVFSPTPPAEHVSAGKTQFSDQNVPTDTLHVSSQIPVYELDNIEDRKLTDRKLSTANPPHMFSGTPVSELDKIENNKDHKLSTAGTRYVFSPSPVPEPDKIIRSESKDHIVPTADTPYVFSSTPVYELENVEDNTSSGTHKKFYDLDHIVSTADTPYVFSSTSVYESENIEDIKSSGTHKKFYDMEHKLSTADTPYVISGTRAYEYNIEDHKFTDHKPPTFDTPHVFSGIPVTELTNIEDNKPTGHKLPTVDTPHVFSGSSASELDKLEDNKSTDIQIKQNAVREQHFASLQPKDHKLTTADTPLMFSGAPVSELDNIQDHKLTDNKASTTDSTYVLSGISAKEFDNIGDRKPIGRKLPTADTPHVFSGSSASGLDKLEDNKSTDHKPPTANTPQVFSGIAVSELDNLEGNKSTDLERLTSDTIQVFRPSHVSQLGSTGGKKRTGTDPMADPLSKPKSDAKWNILEPSADVQSSTSSNPLSEKDATGLATETTNLNMFTEHNEVENTTVLSSTPISEIDSLGKERYTGPHVKYFGKDPNVPCSINEALKYFVNKNHTNVKVTTAPRYPPTNVTILTVEGCSTFVIVVWEKNDNDSATEFELVSTALGPDNETEKIVTVTNQTHITVENLSPNTSYVFLVKPKNRLGVGPPSEPVPFVTESADPRVSEYVPGKAAIWSPYRFKFDSFSECQGKQYVKRTWYRKFVGIILCNSLRYKIYLSDKLSGVFYNIGDLSGHGEDHCQFVDSFLDGRTGHHLLSAQLPVRPGFYRSLRQEPVMFGTIGGHTHISYVHWYECGIAIPGKW